MLGRQLDTLQAYFDLCSQLTGRGKAAKPEALAEAATPAETETGAANAALMRQHACHATEFRGEAVTFKATTAGIIHQMRSCVELMCQREDQWKKRLERQMDKRHHMEDLVRSLQQRIEAAQQQVGAGPLGPDFEEGPGCRLDEDEFFDAVDAQLDRMDEAASSMSLLRASRLPSHGLDPEHPLSQEIATVCQQHWDSWGASTEGMELLESDGPLEVYRSCLEQEGAAVDPILARHTVTGVSAREVAEMFWNLQYRLDWERTLDSAPIVLDTLASDTLLLQQIYKRLWPTAQRDSVFWSHIRHAEQRTMVVNCSTEVGAPPLASGRQRMQLNVSLICETELPEGGRLPTERSQLRCRMQYSARVHPGGWAPMAVLRQVAKREYPRFMRRFSGYCVDRVKHMPLWVTETLRLVQLWVSEGLWLVQLWVSEGLWLVQLWVSEGLWLVQLWVSEGLWLVQLWVSEGLWLCEGLWLVQLWVNEGLWLVQLWTRAEATSQKQQSKTVQNRSTKEEPGDEDQFFDALEAPCKYSGDASGASAPPPAVERPLQSLEHPLAQEIQAVCRAHWDSWGASTDGMELLESDGLLRVYRHRLAQSDAALDPVLATYTVTGVTAHEVAEMFWNLQYRLDWERTLDSAPIVLDTLASDTLLLHQIYKRLWPTAQRDSVFWSHIRHAEQRTMVVNCSTEVGAPPLASGRQRMQLNVSLICETELPEGGRLPTERSQLRCRMQYSARVHPGGWAPKAIIRQVSRREYPRFLRRFAAFCVERVKHQPVSHCVQ
uniref:START domain-containing protein n=1 Tax=Macrostomum lignano TaxID=282301 RepID=A0A1I8GA77_9PLAT